MPKHVFMETDANKQDPTLETSIVVSDKESSSKRAEIKKFWYPEMDKEGHIKGWKIDHKKYIDFIYSLGKCIKHN